MKPENLKKLLHNNRHKFQKNHGREDQLNIGYVKVKDLRSANKAIAFSMARNQVIDDQLNKYMHPNSVHIRLKPYFDSGIWVKWLGVLGDVTLPNKTNLNGSLLIDKISCYPKKLEILDYHVWLNIDNIKYIGHPNQQLAIGDYIEGYSQVKQYGQGKYGLAATYIKKAGMFIGTNKPETLVSSYDRQDSWVVELSNNSLTKKNYTENYLTKNRAAFAANGAHVDTKFQPSRYKKFQQRLQNLKQGESDDVLPLVDKNKQRYLATVVRSHAFKLPNIAHKMPQLEVRDVVAEDSGRLIFAKYYLPYVSNIKKLGELRKDDIIRFTSEASPSNNGVFNMVTDFELLTSHPFIPVPANPNAFLGYIMWRHPEEGESSYIANYQNWALAKQVHTEEISSEIDSLRPTSDLSELDLAKNLGVDKNLVENARKQGLIKPIEENGLTRRYDSNTWNLLRQVIGAQDGATVERLKQIYPIYTTDDIVKKTGISRSEVETRIKQEEFFPLNGLHYSINIYGPKVLNLFKARKTVQSLLPNKTGVIKKREIPVDKPMQLPTEPVKRTKPVNTKKHLIKFIETQPTKPTQETQPTEPVKPTESKTIPTKIKPAVTPKEEKAVVVDKPQPIVPKLPKVNSTVLATLLITTFDETVYEYPVDDITQAVTEIIKANEKSSINKMLKVKNVESGENEIISVKAIMKMKQK